LNALKKILSVLIIIVLFLHTNYLVVYYSLYEINTEELTASCCEKIVVNCNAHCYLDKKINAEDNTTGNENGTAADSKLKITEYVVTDDTPVIISIKQKKSYSINYHLKLQEFITDIDHPPQL
jgi:hypothetical protein